LGAEPARSVPAAGLLAVRSASFRVAGCKTARSGIPAAAACRTCYRIAVGVAEQGRLVRGLIQEFLTGEGSRQPLGDGRRPSIVTSERGWLLEPGPGVGGAYVLVREDLFMVTWPGITSCSRPSCPLKARLPVLITAEAAW
jgi:hypothetical protein